MSNSYWTPMYQRLGVMCTVPRRANYTVSVIGKNDDDYIYATQEQDTAGFHWLWTISKGQSFIRCSPKARRASPCRGPGLLGPVSFLILIFFDNTNFFSPIGTKRRAGLRNFIIIDCVIAIITVRRGKSRLVGKLRLPLWRGVSARRLTLQEKVVI